MTQPEAAPTPAEPLRLDFGCGKNKRPGFVGVDAIAFEGVDVVMDVRGDYTWPWKEGSVDEVFASHFVEHLDGPERVQFFNNLYRVMKVGAQAMIVCPNWSHERAYGDPTHKFPPVSTWMYFYMNKGWRDINAPHCGYTCDFDHAITGSFDPNDAWLKGRNQEGLYTLMYRMVNTTTDITAVLTKRPNG